MTGGLESAARAALPHYGFAQSVTISLVHVSENATFAVDEPCGHRWALRVHRLGYQTEETIRSELCWMAALRAEAGLRTPGVRASLADRQVVEVVEPGTGTKRSCVLFEWLEGTHPAQDDAQSFERLGALTARMHLHSRRWHRPQGFVRFSWDLEAAFGPAPRWGHWQEAIGLAPDGHEVLGRLEQVLRRRLAAYGTGPERFGLVHADTRLANLVVQGDEVAVIDFDDCGFSWYLYDLASAVSFFEDAPEVPDLIERWLAGYRAVAPLAADDQAEVWTFILLRRLLLVAWLGSHRSVDLAHQLGRGYTERTCDLAEHFLTRTR